MEVEGMINLNRDNIPKYNAPEVYNWYALLIAILDPDIPPDADAAFKAMNIGKDFRVRYTMPKDEVIDCQELFRGGLSLDNLAYLTGYSRYRIFRNVVKYEGMQPIE
jgi:hypothetical protein